MVFNQFKKGDKIVIIGGGFGGLQLAKKLSNKAFQVVLIDKQNHHQFQPLFYQVASGRLEPSSISFPFRKIFQHSKNVDFRMADIVRILPDENKLITAYDRSIKYDHLVIATGCKTNFFGNEEMSKHAFSMKTTQESIEIRNKILFSLEKEIFARPEEKQAWMNIVIVGAGPTGVELSGAFAELKSEILPKDYHNIDVSKFNIILLEGSHHTLNNMSKKSREASHKYLDQLGVIVKTDVFLIKFDGKLAILNTGEKIPTKNVIWAAGVTGNVIEGLKPEHVIRNRYKVNRYNCIEGYDNIYAIGDIAYMETPKYPQGHPQVANVAINQGRTLAKNILNSINNKSCIEYEYKDYGMMATIGKHKAVVELPFVKFKGPLAWYVWMFLHLMLILSVRNKLVIFFNWTWSYFTRDTSLRIITNINYEKEKVIDA